MYRLLNLKAIQNWYVIIIFNFIIIDAQSSQNEFLFFEKIYTHTGSKVLYADWDFVTKMALIPNVPGNWEAPIAYNEGTMLVEFEVITMKSVNNPVSIWFGWWNFNKDPQIRHIADVGVYFNKVGKYSGEKKPIRYLKAFYGAGPKADQRCYDWDWANAFGNNTFYTLFMPEGQDPFPITLSLKVYIKGPDTSTFDESDFQVKLTENGLFNNYPNPFNPTTTINYFLSEQFQLVIKVFDSNGQEVVTLINEEKPVGYHSVEWNAKSQPSGLYFYSMTAGSSDRRDTGFFSTLIWLLDL